MSDNRADSLGEMLRARLPDIQQAIYARIQDAVPDHIADNYLDYQAGVRSAVTAMVVYSLEAIRRGPECPTESIPPAAAAQARRAARAGVSLGTILRRYVAGHGEQVETVLSTKQVAELVSAREALYRSGLGENGHERDAKGADRRTLADRAYGLRELRHEAERESYRYSVIDGARWHLTEGLLPPADVATEEVSITGPKQVGFPALECLGQRDNIYRRTEVRNGVDLREFEAQLGHDSPERLTRVIGARMQVLKLKSAKQFFGSGCMGGERSEKFGDLMTYANEDSHYLGHQNGGISTGGRAPIPLDFQRGGATGDLPGIFGDFRAIRLSHEEVDRFDVPGVARVIQYAAWLGAVLNTAHGHGVAISADTAVASVA